MNRINRWIFRFLSICGLQMQILVPVTLAQSPGFSEYAEKTSESGSAYSYAVSSKTYDVRSYELNLTIRPDPFLLQGKATIRLTLPAGTLDQVTFDLEDLLVDSVFQDGLPVNFILSSNELIVTPLTTLTSGDSGTFVIFYEGTPRYGLYRRQNSAGDTVIYSHSEPFDAHFWFPCNDDPNDKATLLLSVSMPSSYEIVSNGRNVGISAEAPGWQRTVWAENYPIATYLISVAAASYQVVEQIWSFDTITMPVNYYVYPADTGRGLAAVTATVSMLSFYSEFIGLYPFSEDKYAMVEVPFAEARGMENQTVTTMRDAAMDDFTVIAHELAHQWWGDAVTPVAFTDIWLNEGFASYFDALYTEYSDGESAFLKRMNDYKGLLFQDGSLAYPVYNPPPQYLFGRAVYFKGAWILHMLRSEVGEELFKTICRNYFQQYKYKNVTTADFIQICEMTSQTALQSFFDQWLNYSGIPDLYLSWWQNQQGVALTLQQMQPGLVYNLNLEILLQGFSSDTLITVSCHNSYTEYQIPFADRVQALILDPAKKVLQINNTPAYYQAREMALVAIYPNPIHDQVSILYQLDRVQHCSIEIWNILGEKVTTLLNEKQASGLHRYVWADIDLAVGTYFCVLRGTDQLKIKKIVILR
jgi:aminopeptidase N